MALNASFNSAKNSKADEFYTLLTDIEKELKHYKHHFKDKTVFMNCDDPKESNFWLYFSLNFGHLGLKKLISTHYEDDKPTYKLEMYYDINGQQVIDQTDLEKNGDFRSPESIKLLKEADIVVTNPPFSLFREYVDQLMKYDKKFLIIGSQNNITYKEIFPLLMYNKVWLGFNSGGFEFEVPNKPPYNEKSTFRIDPETGKSYQKLGNICWFTNLEHSKRNEELILWKQYTKEEYPSYDNYNAIEVSKVKEIPVDYKDIMGVPITYLDSYNPNQFEILGITTARYDLGEEGSPSKRYENAIQHNRDGSTTLGSKINTRAAILYKEPVEGIYYTADNADGYLKAIYVRILIRRIQNENWA